MPNWTFSLKNFTLLKYRSRVRYCVVSIYDCCITLLTIIEVGFIIGGIELNPGPPGQQKLSNNNGKYADFVVK